ncbi:GDSL esterase/lipase At1g71250-like [Silene latifolia]|uniref:GDSL esterase/lipase At1g71250-like n=1 Tax=Silene latifolia TaxID=37657 RepID=UPI003D78A3FB
MENLCGNRIRLDVLKWLNICVMIFGFLHVKVVGNQQFTAMYVFGDSLVDNGNNNYIDARAKANFYPYGIDFYLGPTGRFSNGKIIIDYLSELIGIPYIPPYANPFATDRDIIYGVNYASAAGGILEESGQALGARFSFRQQVENFNITKDQLLNQMNDDKLVDYLSKALAVIILGSNDYINNYLNPSYRTSSKFKPDKYADIVINQYSKQVLALYDLGLRRFFLAGVGPLGCTPSQKTVARLPAGKCLDFSNDAPQMFNARLKNLVDQLNTTHPNATFVFGDTFAAIMDILDHPVTYGLSVIERACCGVGVNNAEKMCLPLLIPCLNRDQYAFWDAFHPSQVVHRILALKAYNGQQNESYPINLKQMAQLKI